MPQLGSTSVGVKRFGPELERRTLCKRQFERFYESAFGLAIADKSDDPPGKRSQLPSLEIAGSQRGPGCAVFASLAAPASISLVECGADTEWSVLALTVNPTERDMATIIAAERATLSQLLGMATEAGCSLRVLREVELTLAGTPTDLDLSPMSEWWYRCSDDGEGVGGGEGGGEAGGEGGGESLRT